MTDQSTPEIDRLDDVAWHIAPSDTGTLAVTWADAIQAVRDTETRLLRDSQRAFELFTSEIRREAFREAVEVVDGFLIALPHLNTEARRINAGENLRAALSRFLSPDNPEAKN